MPFVCIFSHTVYGYSGNELPPPAESGESYAYVSEDGEDLVAFKARMQVVGMEQRRKAAEAPVRRYSWPDGWDWRFSEIRVIPT